MPLVGVLGEVSWRVAWLVVPVVMAAVAGVLLLRRARTAPASARAGLRAVLAQPGVARWSVGSSSRSPVGPEHPVYMGALLVESYDLSIAATGLALGFGALVYVPGNLLFRRWVDSHTRLLLVVLALSAAATVAVVGAVRPSVWFSVAVFSLLCFIAGGRTLAGSTRARPRSRAAPGRHGPENSRGAVWLLLGSGGGWGGACTRGLRRARPRLRGAFRECGHPAPRASTLTRVSFEETIRLREGAVAVRRPLARDAWPGATRGRVERPHAVPARRGPHCPFEAVQAPEGEDAGLHRPGGRSLRPG